MSESASALFSIADVNEFRFARFYIVCEAVMLGTLKSLRIVCGLSDTSCGLSKLGKTRIIADVKSGRVRNSVLCDPNFPACFYPECDRMLSVNLRNNLNSGAISPLLS